MIRCVRRSFWIIKNLFDYRPYGYAAFNRWTYGDNPGYIHDGPAPKPPASYPHSGVPVKMPICPFRPHLRAVLFSFLIKTDKEEDADTMDEHTELSIELMRKTIEQKDEQIQKLRETVENLQVTVASLNETIVEFRRKFFGVG